MVTTRRLVTVEEYARLPDTPGARDELRHGQVILMAHPPRYHADIQDNIYFWLKLHCRSAYCIRAELACRPLPEYEVWAVNVGVTTNARWRATKGKDWLRGSPELAIEVLSPSNTTTEMEDRRDTLFQGGCEQFWTVDRETRSVTVSTPGGTDQIFSGGGSVPLEPYAPNPIPLDEIFAGIE
jgi:Uma2 family endonuclease